MWFTTGSITLVHPLSRLALWRLLRNIVDELDSDKQKHLRCWYGHAGHGINERERKHGIREQARCRTNCHGVIAHIDAKKGVKRRDMEQCIVG